MVNESQSVNSNSVNPAKNEPEIASGLLEGITGGLGEITEGTVNGIDNEFAELGLAPRHEPRIEFDDSPFAPILISKPKDLVPIIHTGPLLGGHPGPKKFPSIDPHGGAGVMITGSPVQIFDNKVPLPEAAQETNNKILENLPGKPP
ncbi:MAG: hypothetical protein OXU45_07350, partial [Candidatus Melainabacteria bacterium]|nr:hypothetical protein [Candidatus Melainabacteria bacterium]